MFKPGALPGFFLRAGAHGPQPVGVGWLAEYNAHFEIAKSPSGRRYPKESGMVEEKVELRDINYRQVLPWTELFKGFQLALDPKKLLLAAAGIVVMYLGWWVLSTLFYAALGRNEPTRSDFPSARYLESGTMSQEEADARATADLERAHYQWELLNETAGPGGRLSTLPWFEWRGQNPYLWVTDQQQRSTLRSNWQFVRSQGLVLVEPLRKFLTPVIYLLKPHAGFWNCVYFALILLWTLATWALFGGAITRMAAVQLARKEKISIAEALGFTRIRYVSFFSAPVFPLVFVVAILVLQIIYGWFHLIPVFGDIVVDGLGFPLMLLAGLIMAVILVGLLAWPLMYATISTEGSDSFDALSRSYSYIYQAPWHYLWNSFVAILYGALVIFFVGFMGSLSVYLAKWGVSQAPGQEKLNREPSYLFVYAPTSFGWRQLLLQGSPAMDPVTGDTDGIRYENYVNNLSWWNRVGAFLVSIWLYLAFLLIIGFGYSYFWSSATIIYLLMRRHVDDTELDEIYIEEDEAEDTFGSPAPSTTPATAPAGSTPLQMVEPSKPAPTAAEATAPDGGEPKPPGP